MSRRALVASVLSMPVPGLGQIYAGRSERGAAILVAAIIVGNLNAIWLTLYGQAGPNPAFWARTLPRILHDWFAAWAVVFWIWQVVDAYRQAERAASAPEPPGQQTAASDGD